MREKVYGVGRIACVEGASYVVTDIRLEAVHRKGGRFAVGADIARGQGYGNLVLGVFSVHNNLVSGHPGGLFTVFRKGEGELERHRLNFLFPLRGFIGGRCVSGLCAGKQEYPCRKGCDACKYLFHNVSFLNYCSQSTEAVYSYHSSTALAGSPSAATPIYMLMSAPQVVVHMVEADVSKEAISTPLQR